MKSRRITALLLAGILLSASLASCASDEQEQNESSVGTETADAAQAETDADEIDFSSMSFVERVRYANAGVSDGLPEKKYGGKDVTIHGVSAYPTEMTGDVVNDARYQQSMKVEERFDVNVNYVNIEYANWNNYVHDMKEMFLAGDSFCDLFVNWNTSTAGFVCEGFFEDLSQYSVIDTTKPWYFGDEMNLYGNGGRLYVATGMMDVPAVTGGTECLYFNKEIAKNYNVEDLYNVVREGKWTLDYVRNLIADFYYDIDGDGSASDADVYGLSYAAAGSWMCTLATLGIPQIDKDAEGSPCLTVFTNAEKAQPIMDSMKEMLALPGARSLSDWDYEAFRTNCALLCASNLQYLTTLRDSDINYGILPRFKADEAQKDYCSSYLPDPWAIPITASDKELAAVILTAIAAEGFREVLPSYYETAIKSKFSTDEESGEMLDLMLRNVRSDGMFIYGDSSYIYNLWHYLVADKGFSSYWESQRRALEKKMNDTLEKIAALGN